MSVIGAGIDIVDMRTLREARFKQRVSEYFLTAEELALVPSGAKLEQHLASRFAAKEAVIKAFPDTLSPFDFKIEKKGVRPVVVFFSEAHSSKYSVHISLSHTEHTAAAVAVVSQEESK